MTDDKDDEAAPAQAVSEELTASLKRCHSLVDDCRSRLQSMTPAETEPETPAETDGEEPSA